MKKFISITTVLLLSVLNLLAKNEANIVANFGIENKASSTYQIKLISKTDPNNEEIFEIPALSKINLEIEKTLNEWKNTKIIVDSEAGEKNPLDISGNLLSDDVESAQGTSSDIKQEKGHKDDFDLSNKIAGGPESKSNALSLLTTDRNTFIVKNKMSSMEYTIHESEPKDDGKTYRKISIRIAAKQDQLTFALGDKVNNKKTAPYFYEITGNSIDPNNPVYLLGTCHTLSPNDYPEDIRNKIENTQILISEFPQFATETTVGQHSLSITKLVYNKFLEQDFYWFRDQLMALSYGPDEIKESILLMQKRWNELQDPNFFQSWFTQFTEDEQQMIEGIVATEGGIDLTSIHPALLSDFIFLIGEASLEKELVEDSYEQYLIKQFSKNNKQVVYLDTMESLVFGAIDDGNGLLQRFQKDLDSCITNIQIHLATWKQSASTEKDCWNAEDAFLAFDLNPIISEPLEASMHARNLAWQNKVVDALNSGKSASIITGANHLLGKTGFLKFLKSQGYNIKHGNIDHDTQNQINDILDFQQWLNNVNAELAKKNHLLEDGNPTNQHE